MTYTSTELNLLIYKYLDESGFAHSAYVFAQEANLCDADIDCKNVGSGALTNIVQRGLFYAEAELGATGYVNALNNGNGDVDAAMLGRTYNIENLSLIEAVATDPLRQRLARDKPSTSGTGSSQTSEKDDQKDRARNNKENGTIPKKDKLASPKSNGVMVGVHGKKQQAAQQQAAAAPYSGTVNGASTTAPIPVAEINGNRRINPNNADSFTQDQVRFLKCHNSEVFICAWNPKDDIMASGSGDSTARIWDLHESEDPRHPSAYFESRTSVLKHSSNASSEDLDKQHNNKDVTSLDWNKSGNMLATGCYDGYARVWNADGRLRCQLGAHKGPIFALKWNETNDTILSAGVDKTTIVWDALKGVQVQQFNFHNASALDVDWITEDTFASCSTDTQIHVCRIGADRPIKTYSGHLNEVNAIRYDKHSNRLASCSDDMTLKIWSLEDNERLVYDWKAHSKEIYAIRWSPQGNVLASASFDHTVRLWDVRRGECIRTLSRHTDPVYSVSFSPDGRYLASGCFDRSVFLWEVNTGRLIQSYYGEKNLGGIFEVSWNYLGDKVAASASDGTVILLDVRHIKNRIL